MAKTETTDRQTQVRDRSRSYSQFREDIGVLQFFGKNYTGRFVDVGANDGVSGSNSYLLERNGWTGVLVEPSVDLAAACKRARPGSVVVNKAAVGDPDIHIVDFFEFSPGAAGERFDGISTIGRPSDLQEKALAAGSRVEHKSVPAATLDVILDEAMFEGPIDLLSIDVEGHELDVLRGLSLDRYRPRLIVLEDNSFGTDAAIREYLASFGYRRFARSFVNEWYVAPEVSGQPVRFRYPLLMYFDFKRIAAQLGFLEHPGFWPVMKGMISTEETSLAWGKWILFVYTPVFVIRYLFALLTWGLNLVRSMGRQR